MEIKGNKVFLPMRSNIVETFPEDAIAILDFKENYIDYNLKCDCQKVIINETEEAETVDSFIDQRIYIPYSSISKVAVIIEEGIESFVLKITTTDVDETNFFIKLRRDAKKLAEMILERKANDAKRNYTK